METFAEVQQKSMNGFVDKFQLFVKTCEGHNVPIYNSAIVALYAIYLEREDRKA